LAQYQLCTAAGAGDVEAVRTLLATGADPNALDYDSRSALHVACSDGQAATAALLLEAGANVAVVDRWSHTPLDEAVRCGHSEVVALVEAHLATLGVRASTTARLATALHTRAGGVGGGVATAAPGGRPRRSSSMSGPASRNNTPKSPFMTTALGHGGEGGGTPVVPRSLRSSTPLRLLSGAGGGRSSGGGGGGDGEGEGGIDVPLASDGGIAESGGVTPRAALAASATAAVGSVFPSAPPSSRLHLRTSSRMSINLFGGQAVNGGTSAGVGAGAGAGALNGAVGGVGATPAVGRSRSMLG